VGASGTIVVLAPPVQTEVKEMTEVEAHRLECDGDAPPNHGAERGSATAEYAIATMAAVGFAGLLVVIMRSDEVRGMLMELVRNALSFSG
jgi:hypothetical protein